MSTRRCFDNALHTLDGGVPIFRAIARTPNPCFLRLLISATSWPRVAGRTSLPRPGKRLQPFALLDRPSLRPGPSKDALRQGHAITPLRHPTTHAGHLDDLYNRRALQVTSATATWRASDGMFFKVWQMVATGMFLSAWRLLAV